MATGIGESFFLTDFIEVGAKEFPLDERFEFGKEVIELINLGELVFDIEERRRTMMHGMKKQGVRDDAYKNINFSKYVHDPTRKKQRDF